MHDSPFRRIVLPALLASSAGFAVLTWPLASNQGIPGAQYLPPPMRNWVDSALVTDQHKEFSIRYIGLAILSSVAIGVGTAEVMRGRQAQGQRHRRLLTQMLAAGDDGPETEAAAAPEAPDAIDQPSLAQPPAASTTWSTTPGLPALDWASLSSPNLTSPPAPPAPLVTPTTDHSIYQVQGADQRYHLALESGGKYYRYYRRRPDLGKAQQLIEALQGQGKAAIATQDGSDYVVWLHQPARSQQVCPWGEASPVN